MTGTARRRGRSAWRYGLPVMALVATAAPVALDVANAPLAGALPIPQGPTAQVSPRIDLASSAGVVQTPAFSADGNWVAFVSTADVLNPDTNDPQVFVGRLDGNSVANIVRISQAEPSDCGSTPVPGNAPSQASANTSGERGVGWDPPAISSDGRYVAFATRATNLASGTTVGGDFQQIVLYNRLLGSEGGYDQCENTGFTYVSATGPATAPVLGNDDSRSPTIGGFQPVVGFASTASNLVPGDTNGVQDVFRWVSRGQQNTIHLASRLTSVSTVVTGRSTYQYTLPNGPSRSPSITEDGRMLTFVSTATNLVDNVGLWGGDDRTFGSTTATTHGDDDLNGATADVFGFFALESKTDVPDLQGPDGGTSYRPPTPSTSTTRRTVTFTSSALVPTRVGTASWTGDSFVSITSNDCAGIIPAGGTCSVQLSATLGASTSGTLTLGVQDENGVVASTPVDVIANSGAPNDPALVPIGPFPTGPLVDGPVPGSDPFALTLVSRGQEYQDSGEIGARDAFEPTATSGSTFTYVAWSTRSTYENATGVFPSRQILGNIVTATKVSSYGGGVIVQNPVALSVTVPSSGPAVEGDGDSTAPSFAGGSSGSVIVYESTSSNLGLTSTSTVPQVFASQRTLSPDEIFQLPEGDGGYRTQMVTRAGIDGNPANQPSVTPAAAYNTTFDIEFSFTRLLVGFGTTASNLTATTPLGTNPDVVVAEELGGLLEWDYERIITATPVVPRPAIDASNSANGAFVAFSSESADLVPGDVNNVSDIFVRDTVASTTRRITELGGVGFPFASIQPSISGDGRFIAYTTATPIDPADGVTSECPSFELAAFVTSCRSLNPDVYVYDTQAATTTWVSVGYTIDSSGNVVRARSSGVSSQPSISADGRFVAFKSTAPNLLGVAGALTSGATLTLVSSPVTTSVPHIFVWDRTTGLTQLVTPDATGNVNLAGNQASASPSISDDGRFVAYVSVATNTVAPTLSGTALRVFRADRSLDGSALAVTADRLRPGPATLGSTLVDTATTTPGVIAIGLDDLNGYFLAPSISGTGSRVAYTKQPEASTLAILLRDLGAGTTPSPISPTSGVNFAPAISGDGRMVAFASNTDIPATGDNPSPTSGVDLFMTDTESATTTELMSVGPDVPATNLVQGTFRSTTTGPLIRATSLRPDLDAFGNHVAFESNANEWAETPLPNALNVTDVWQRTFSASLSIVLTPQDYGSTPIGTPVAGVKKVELRNDGYGAARITGTALAGDTFDFVPASIPSTETCTGRTIRRGERCTLFIASAFDPSAAGPRLLTAAPQLDPGTPAAAPTGALTGTGVNVDKPALSIAPATHTFAPTAQGQTSPALTFTITNTGNVSLALNAATFAGSTDFQRTGGTCAANALAVSASCTIIVVFKPTIASGAAAGSVTVTTKPVNANPGPTVTGTMNGRVLTPNASLQPNPANFGSVNVGVQSGTITLTLKNTGQVTFTPTSRTITGTNPGDFKTIGLFAPACVGTPIAPGATCTTTHAFQPTATGNRSATLTITTNVPGISATARLVGTGILTVLPKPAISVQPNPADFGPVPVGATSGTKTLTVTNTGNQAYTVTSRTIGGANPADFTIGNGAGIPCLGGPPLAAGASCTLSIHTFKPIAVGARSATVVVGTSIVGLVGNAALTGTGTAPAIVIDPNPMDFGDVILPGSSNRITAVVRNTGGVQVKIAGFTVGGDNPADFTVLDPGPGRCIGAVLAPGTTCLLGSFGFTPATVGLRRATVTVTTATPGLSANASLVGAGLPTPLPKPPDLNPVVEVVPSIAALGDVVLVKGRGFPKGAPVILRWSQGIKLDRGLLSDADGSFITSVLILPRDQIGERDIQALFGGTNPATDGLKVVLPTAEPRGTNPAIFRDRDFQRG